MRLIEVPSNRQVGLEGSTSLTLRSLLETLRVLTHNLLDVHVSNLRKKLGADLIVTRRGHGYIIP